MSVNKNIEVLPRVNKIFDTMAIPARRLVEIDPKELIHVLNGTIKIKFDTGEVITTHGSHAIISSFLWQALREFPELKLRPAYMINNYYVNGLYNGGSHTDLYSVLFRDIVEEILIPKGLDNPTYIDPLYKAMMDSVNYFYNELTFSKLKYVLAIDLYDLLAIQRHPDHLVKMRKNEEHPTLDNVEGTYQSIRDIINSKEYRLANPLARAYLSGAINPRQVNQVLGARGYITELDSTIFSTPITKSFTEGFDTMPEIAKESRSCAKALYLSNEAIKTSESFAKELQLGSMTIEEIVYTDCGTKDYTDWYVKGTIKNYGHVIYSGDIPKLVGKLYLNEETGKEEYITKNHTHLEGKTIKLRTILNCKIGDPKKICSKCMGKLSASVPKHFNVGHHAVTTITKIVSQNILSTKHITVSAATAAINIDKFGEKYLQVKNDSSYALKPEYCKIKSKRIEMLFSQKALFGLAEIRNIENLKKVDPERTTNISSVVIIEYENDKVKDVVPVKLQDGNRTAFLEARFLEYILNGNYRIDDDGNYVIDMRDWTSAMPIISLRQIEFSYLQFAREIINLIKYRKKSRGVCIDTPESLLSKFFTLLNSKLDINIALMEIAILSITTEGGNDMSISRNPKTRELATLKDVLTKRSLGSAMGWGYIRSTITSPYSYVKTNRQSHPLDVLLKPNEVIAANRKRNGD